MFSVYIGTRDPVQNYADIRQLDAGLRRQFFARCTEKGVYFHSNFSVSAAHTQDVLDEVLTHMEEVAVA